MAKSGMSESDVDSDGDGDKLVETEDDHETKTEKSTSSVGVISKRSTVSTPISILIESLVKNLCSIYASDAEKVTKTYNLICDKLFKMNMIDESYNMNEFEGMRAAYQQAFQHLLKIPSLYVQFGPTPTSLIHTTVKNLSRSNTSRVAVLDKSTASNINWTGPSMP
jgi:hypothetical protein